MSNISALSNVISTVSHSTSPTISAFLLMRMFLVWSSSSVVVVVASVNVAKISLTSLVLADISASAASCAIFASAWAFLAASSLE